MPKDSEIKQSQIVIIDDEPENVQLLQSFFEWKGYSRVAGVTDPLEAIELCRTLQPDIILLDLDLPGLDGFAILEQLPEVIPKDDFVPILVFADEVDPSSKRRALALGATDFLPKPKEVADIAIRVYNCLRMRHLRGKVLLQKEVFEDKIRAYQGDLELARLEAVHRLARAAEYRDDDTGKHIHRVSMLAATITVQLPTSGIHPLEMSVAAPLHDVGKIGIPDSILLKCGKLTTEEHGEMMTHTTIGYDILAGSASPVLQMAASIALTHHEKWDGSGYPNGLSGTDIPIEGRILAVADVFDALTHKRPYKEAWSNEAALAEVRRMSGSHFDPDVVEAFLSLHPQDCIEDEQVKHGVKRFRSRP